MTMNFREEMHKIFRGDPTAKVLWQPRIEHWFGMNKRRGTLPEPFAEGDVFDVYEAIDASIRYLPSWCPVRHIDDPSVKYSTSTDGDAHIYTTTTPVGAIRRVESPTSDSPRIVEFPVKTKDDLRVVRYLIEGANYEPDTETYLADLERHGNRAMTTALVPRVNVMRLFIEYCGFEDGVYLLHDAPEEVRSFTDVADAADLRYCRALLETPAEFINYGDNIHCDMLPPPLLKEYVMPAYHQRNELLQPAGRFTFSHWDGDVRTIIPYARETGMDGLEAITFQPMGDATFEMIEEHMGKDMVLVDGICATSFLPFVSMEEFDAEVRMLIDHLHPRLVLGVSDEPPPDAEYRKLQRVTEIVAEYNGD